MLKEKKLQIITKEMEFKKSESCAGAIERFGDTKSLWPK
jgi:hypothetical protein